MKTLTARDLEPADLVKIDIEGAEEYLRARIFRSEKDHRRKHRTRTHREKFRAGTVAPEGHLHDRMNN